MAFWTVGLATRASAERAAKWGGIACFFQAIRETLGNIVTVSIAGKPLDNAIAWFVGASLLPILLFVAGLRLWRHAGWVWGTVAAVAVALDLASASLPEATKRYATVLAGVAPHDTLAVLTALVAALAIKIVMLVLIINGTRGALAQRKIDYSNDVGRVFS